METVKTLETTLQGWYKSAPNLPEDWRKWLAVNAWWLVVIGVILSVIGLLGGLMALLTLWGLFGAVMTGYNLYGIGVNSQPLVGLGLVSLIAALVFMAVTLYLMVRAVKPLQNMKKEGWELMFWAFLVGVVSSAVNIVLTFNAVSFVFQVFWALVGAAIGGYFLFQVRSYFGAKAAK